ncbi:MAG: ATP-binding cassette domain-containing protein, partial [Phycisphaerales bacterium JB037]
MRGVSFQIPPRAVTGLLGPNGAGKSTTIRMITGFLPPDAGSITVDGLDARTQSLAVRRRIGYLPESAPAYPEMRTIDFLRYRAKLFGVPAPQRRTAIER